MDVVTKDVLRDLLQHPTAPCVSLFMPTHRLGIEAHQQDPVRFRNHLREAEGQLEAYGLRPNQIREVLDPAQRLLDDPVFWSHLFEGLAVFLAPDLFRYFRVDEALSDLVMVGDKFDVKPLVPALAGGGHWWVLALSRKQARLIRCNRHDGKEIDVPGMPRDLDDALQYDTPQRQNPFHSRAQQRGGEQAGMYYGHGEGEENEREDVREYLKIVERSVYDHLADDKAPLVVAAVDYVVPIYKAVNRRSTVVDEALIGSPDDKSPRQLRDESAKLVQPVFDATREAAIDRFKMFSGQGDGRASSHLATVLDAAQQGRVDTLFVPIGIQTWGRVDDDNLDIEVHAAAESGDQDLLGTAASLTLLSGGTVFAVEPRKMPDGEPVAALFRW